MMPFRPGDWYRPIESPTEPVLQGDQLFGATVRSVIPGDDPPGSWDVGYLEADVIIATHSCDLEQRRVAQVEIIPAYPLGEWLAVQPHMLPELEAIRRGNAPGLYLLPGWPEAPIAAARVTRIVPFDEKLSMTWPELDEAVHGPRMGLRSPYIEHFGQAVARFYMRVGLPENMPEIEWETLGLESGEKSKSLPLTVKLAPNGRRLALEATLPAQVHRIRLLQGPDVLYRLRLDRDGSYFGVGPTVEEAAASLRDRIARRYEELSAKPPEEGARTHWLLKVFQQKN